MARDVQRCVEQLLVQHQGMTEEAAALYVKGMITGHRYMCEVWS